MTAGYRPTTGRRRRRSFAIAVPLVLALAASSFLGVSAVANHGRWARTERVQHHGIRATGHVTRMSITVHGGRSTTYTTQITVALDEPVGGVRTTVAHVSSGLSVQNGQPITVAVDPRSPGYAELPGRPTEKASTWRILTALAVGFGLLALAVAALAVRLRRRRPDAHAA